MIVYQVIHTVLVFGIMDGTGHQIVSASKDLIRIFACIALMIWSYRMIKWYLHRRLWIWIICLITIWWSLIRSWYWWVDTNLIIIWFKYVIYPFVILLTATRRWYCISDNNLTTYLRRLSYIAIRIWIWGFIWFGFKMMMPQLAMEWWYGPVGDFVVWSNPPIYYRTGAWGRPRYSWLMAWPNNLSYLLVGLWPLLIMLWKWSSYQYIKKVWLILSGILTFSRSAWIGALWQYIIIHYRQYTIQNKYIKIIWISTMICIVWVLVWFKYDSTIWHLHSSIQAIHTRIQQPMGYGLWYSWPSALHHGSIIPENTYLQWLIDIGLIGTAWLIMIIVMIIRTIIAIDKKNLYRPMVYARGLGMIGLAIQGMFLHVLEDSTVNYLVLIVWWLLLWYISRVDKWYSS